MTYANRYREAALAVLPLARGSSKFDPVAYQLLCQSLELHLKSFVWLKEQIGRDAIRKEYWHDIEKLWGRSKTIGIESYVRVTGLRDSVIALVGPYYKNRQFTYLDLDMVFSGFKNLKREPRALVTLSRLTGQLAKTLRKPILEASQGTPL